MAHQVALHGQGGELTGGRHQAPGARTRGAVKAHPDWTLVPVSLAVAMVGLDATLVAIANPYIGRDMHCSLSDLQWIVNAYLLALAVLLIPMGKIGDRFGRRLMFVVGAGGFGLSSLGVGVVGSIGGVIGFRAAQGVFGAMLMPSTLAILRSAFPPERLNRAIAIWGAAAAVSVAAGPVVGGLLVQHASWEWCFFINVPGGAVTIALGLLMLAETRGWDHAAAFDFRGLAFLGAGLFCVVFGLVKADAWGWVTTKTLGFLLVGVALVVAFGLSELRASAPLVPMRLFRSLRMTFGSLTVVFIFFGLFGVLFFVSLYLQNVHGYDPVAATGQVAGGANLVCFTTGRGSVFGCKPAPSIKLATNTPMFRHIEDDMDVNCGTILDGDETVQECGQRIFALMLRVASGERTKSESFDFGAAEFAPWVIGATM